jgi:hypothetical protein
MTEKSKNEPDMYFASNRAFLICKLENMTTISPASPNSSIAEIWPRTQIWYWSENVPGFQLVSDNVTNLLLFHRMLGRYLRHRRCYCFNSHSYLELPRVED